MQLTQADLGEVNGVRSVSFSLGTLLIPSLAAKERGYDAGKKIVGRKRHIAVDTNGRSLMVNLTPADIADSTGALAILEAQKQRWPGLKHLFADGAYDASHVDG